jgi:Bacterial regulatory proteins, luxR family
VLDAVQRFLPWYSSVGHGVGYKAQASVLAYQSARLAALAFAGRGPDTGDVAVICPNATEAIQHLAGRLRLSSGAVVVTTVAEHRANLLPRSRAASCRYVECGQDGTFEPADVAAALVVIRLLAAGLSQRDIAAQLIVSLNTVKAQVRTAYRKLGAGTRVQALQQTLLGTRAMNSPPTTDSP